MLPASQSDVREPLNIGSSEMVSMNEMMEMVMGYENRPLSIKHIPGPEGVRGRNSGAFSEFLQRFFCASAVSAAQG